MNFIIVFAFVFLFLMFLPYRFTPPAILNLRREITVLLSGTKEIEKLAVWSIFLNKIWLI
ncbi:MAG TPA: hypothetical protein DCY88_34545 [Cyanobacteria bacterium UBA11372]|nr:hypothetical protein [Cyanobacteria bacterium UBA11372]